MKLKDALIHSSTATAELHGYCNSSIKVDVIATLNRNSSRAILRWKIHEPPEPWEIITISPIDSIYSNLYGNQVINWKPYDSNKSSH